MNKKKNSVAWLPKKVSEDASNLERILSSIQDGRQIALSFVRQLAVTDEKYKEFIREYDADKRVDLGTLCEKCNIPPADFLADINREMYPVLDEAMQFAQGLATHEISKRLPTVAKRAGIEGSKVDGVFDRHQLLMKSGHHVAPKGTVISMNQINQQAAGLPSFEDETKSLADILTVNGAVVEDNLLETGETDYIEEFEEDLEEQLA